MARATKQLTIDLPSVESGLLGDVDVTEEHGEVFTLRWVVELILDLAGYTADRDLAATVAVEPACGAGAFLGPMAERLVESARAPRADVV